MSETKTMSSEEQLTALRIKREELELEDLQMRVDNERSRRDFLKVSRQKQQETLTKAEADKAKAQARCKHRKGGKNLAGIEKGNDSDYSVIMHTYPWGETRVMCTRCQKEWKKPQPGEKDYARKLEEWQAAMQFETDNEPSGNRIFMIVDNTAQEAQAAAESKGQPRRKAQRKGA